VSFTFRCALIFVDTCCTHFTFRSHFNFSVEYVAQCHSCQLVKAEHQKPAGLLKPLEVPMWKCDQISMDFVVGLPRKPSGQDAIWVIVDRLTKSAHFFPIKITDSMERLVDLYVREITECYGNKVEL